VQTHTGTRIGELTHVEKADYDPVEKELTIWRSKTEAGQGRVVPLDEEAVEAIEWVLAKQDEDQKFWKLPIRQQTWLFRGLNGRKWNENFLNKWFRHTRETLGLP
jgi:integrase